MGNSDFSIQPCQSKFTIWKVKVNRNFGEFVRFFRSSLTPNKFRSNLKAVLLSGFLFKLCFEFELIS
jgi:hypothetical protein